jgi:hypothetical protein
MSQTVTTKFHAVMGLYRSGSTALAGALYRLGADMGEPFFEDFYEPAMLSTLLRSWWNEPKGRAAESSPGSDVLGEHAPFSERLYWLSRYKILREHRGYPTEQPPVSIGMKHPLLCLSAVEFLQAFPGARLIWSYRPLEESVQSLVRLGWWDQSTCARMQQKLWDAVQTLMEGREHLRVDFRDMKFNPQTQIERLIEYLSLSPTAEQKQAAIQSIQRG